jgi:hypothetical protein
MVVQDAEVLCDPVIFQRGDPSARGTPIPRRFLGVLSTPDRSPFTRGGGRLDLADAIASPTNPLTARVWANRVWMHHFGEPLVENPGDFGLQAKPPVQLDVLDFLANYFIEHGWRTKPLHELILTSRAYQRTSQVPESEQFAAQQQTDASNSLLWRANRRDWISNRCATRFWPPAGGRNDVRSTDRHHRRRQSPPHDLRLRRTPEYSRDGADGLTSPMPTRARRDAT